MYNITRAKKVQHPTAKRLYTYALGRRFDPGAMAEVYLPLRENPLENFVGPATLCALPRVTQHPQVYFNQQIGINGLGGVQAGQFINAPLFDPSE